MPTATTCNPLCRSGGILHVTYRVERPARPPSGTTHPAYYDEGAPAEIRLESCLDEDDREVLHLLSALDYDAVEQGVFSEGIENDE